MGTIYTINKLCKLTSVSVRTLHYYDEIGLLKPSYRSDNGRRLYGDNDLLRLQQIVTFRFLGFTLSQITLILKNDQPTMFRLIKLQASAIADEAVRIEKASKFLNYLIHLHDQQQTVDWSVVANIIDLLKQKEINAEQWYQKYLSREELKQFQKFAKTRTEKWLALFNEIRNHLDTDPEGKAGARLVKKWIALADEAYGDHPELRGKLWQAYKTGLIPENFFPYDQDVIAYLSRAFEKVNRD